MKWQRGFMLQNVNFIRLGLLSDANQITRIGKVAVLQNKIQVIDVRSLVQIINPVLIK
jgi:hypothetical protein